jgi:phage portal protein BeeE
VPGVLDRVSARVAASRGDESRYSIDSWISDYLIPSAGQFTYGSTSYPFGAGLSQTLAGNRVAEIAQSIPGYRQALQQCPPAFAAEMVRSLVLSQARFTFRSRMSAAQPRRTFGNRDLGLLERPWANGTTGDLLARAEWHAGLAGNAYVYRQPGRLRVLRPDWTAILYGSQSEPEWPSGALDAELIGYVYANRGVGVGEPHLLLPEDVAHWAPLPDPEMTGLGMSWLTPAIREMQLDRIGTEHKVRFFEQGATPNLVVKGIPAVNRTQFEELVTEMESRHAGVANAYRTLYLTQGADASVIGANLRDLDLDNLQGATETRIAILSRVPAALLGISKGLTGSSLNAGNLAMTRRIFSDTWVYPALQDVASSLAPIVTVPADAELWFDTADMPILREDARDAADIEAVKATTITMYVKEGFTPESSIAAVRGQDISLLKHTGLVSVQLWEPGAESPRKPEPGAESPSQPAGAPVPAGNGKAPPVKSAPPSGA